MRVFSVDQLQLPELAAQPVVLMTKAFDLLTKLLKLYLDPIVVPVGQSG